MSMCIRAARPTQTNSFETLASSAGQPARAGGQLGYIASKHTNVATSPLRAERIVACLE